MNLLSAVRRVRAHARATAAALAAPVGAVAMAALTAAPALAHDTWFERVEAGERAAAQPLQLALGTGTHYPRYEDPVQPKYLAHLACVDGQGTAYKTEPARAGRRHTVVRVPGLDAAAFSCVARLHSFEIELTPALVDVYFEEIRAGDALRAVLSRQRAQGQPFEERYLKVARIEGLVAPARPQSAERQPLDVLRVAPGGVLKAGAEAVFEVQRDGKPLADQPVQLLNDAAPAGLWARTDAAGRITIRLPLPGRWLLRGVDLRPPASEGARWESRFIAYTFEVAR
ncbi:MAG: DUF4198 domain-containing protein [Rubrivivax sp.]|nr:DUF4198 domain-containing protein [Rubrivivax sp.]